MTNRFDPSLYTSEEGRAGLYGFGLRDFGREALDVLREQNVLLDRQLRAVVVEGMWYAHSYWDDVREMLQADSGLLCCVGTRVRLHKGSFEALWYRNSFVKGAAGSKSRVFSTHIRKYRGMHYSMSQFQGKHDGPFRELIEITESRYRGLRERAAILTDVRRRLRVFERHALAELSDRDRLKLQGDISSPGLQDIEGREDG